MAWPQRVGLVGLGALAGIALPLIWTAVQPAEGASAKQWTAPHPPPLELSDASPAEQLRQEIETAEGRFTSEARDSIWAEATETSVSEELPNLGEKEGFSLSKVECRTKSCRVEVYWDDPAH